MFSSISTGNDSDDISLPPPPPQTHALSALPCELWIEIFLFLPYPNILLNISLISREFLGISYQDILWRRISRETFGVDLDQFFRLIRLQTTRREIINDQKGETHQDDHDVLNFLDGVEIDNGYTLRHLIRSMMLTEEDSSSLGLKHRRKKKARRRRQQRQSQQLFSFSLPRSESFRQFRIIAHLVRLCEPAVVVEEDDDSVSVRCKCVFLGAVGVGRKSLLQRWIHRNFDESGEAQSLQHTAFISRSAPGLFGVPLSLDLWNIVWDPWMNRGHPPSYWRGCNACFAVFDVTDESTLVTAGSWIKQVRKDSRRPMHSPQKVVYCLIGSKSDLLQIEVGGNPKEILCSLFGSRDWATTVGGSGLDDLDVIAFVSSKSGFGVDELFQDVTRRIHAKMILCAARNQ